MIVVHIGLPKCGSATIQTFLNENDEALRALAVDYPRVGRVMRRARQSFAKAHHNFANELKGRAEKFNPVAGRVTDLPEHIRNSSFGTTVLSSEAFATCNAEAIERLGPVLKSAGQPVRIVMVIRSLMAQAPSSYAQRIRHGYNTHDFDAFFDQWRQDDRFNPFEIASRWAGVFGWDAMRVRVLDPSRLLNGDLIDDFLDGLDLDPDALALRALPRQPRVNESAGWMTLEAIRAMFAGRSGMDRDHPLARLIENGLPDHKMKRLGVAAEQTGEALGWSRDRGRYLTRVQAEQLNVAYIDCTRRLSDHLPLRLQPPQDLDALGFVEREFLPDATYIPAKALGDFYQTLADRVAESADMISNDPDSSAHAQKQADKKAKRTAKRKAERQASSLAGA